MTPDKLMRLIDDYACEVANAPSRPTPIERKLATERIERARNAVVTELAKPPTQPAWHDQPTQPGLWVWDRGPLKLQHLIAVGDLQGYLTREPTSPERWFGPIPLPEDTK